MAAGGKPDDIAKASRAFDAATGEFIFTEKQVAKLIRSAILAERERCAGIARSATKVGNEPISLTIEKAIRGER